jgi:hypothetical protein
LHPRPHFHKSIRRIAVASRPLPPRRHYACNDLALRELVTAWHQLPDDVRETIVRIARDASDLSRVGELVTLMFGLPLESGIGTKPIT